MRVRRMPRAALAAIASMAAWTAAWTGPSSGAPLPVRELPRSELIAEGGGLSRLDVSRGLPTDGPLVAVVDSLPARSVRPLVGRRLVRVEDVVSLVTRRRFRAARTEHANQVVDLVAGAVDGACPTCRVIVYGVMRWVAGMPMTEDSLVAQAVDRAVRARVRVINLSLGGDGRPEPVLARAINRALARGIVVVAAAGNEPGQARLIEPANHPGVLSVGAVNRSGEHTFSGQRIGPTLWAQGSELEADGISVVGSSFAAPQVAGVAAVMTADRRWRPRNRAGVMRLVARLRESATVLDDGRRLLDAGAALGAAQDEVFAGPDNDDGSVWNLSVDLRRPATVLVCSAGRPFALYSARRVGGVATGTLLPADADGPAQPLPPEEGWRRARVVRLDPGVGRTLWQLVVSRDDSGARPIVTLDPADCPPAPAAAA